MKLLAAHAKLFGIWFITIWAMGFVLPGERVVWSGTESSPPDFSLTASVEKRVAKIGDLLWLTLAYDLPEGGRLTEKPVIHGIEELVIVDKTAQAGEIKYRFIVDRLGSFKTEPIGLTYIDKDGNEQQLETDAVTVTVQSNLGQKPEEAALRPIQDIMPTGSKWRPFLPWVGAVFILLGCVGGWLWWRRKHRADPSAITGDDPPHVRAEMEIKRLVASEMFEKGDVKAFYFNFSEILRRYMESIRHFPAAEMTTEEIVRQVANNSKDQKMLPLLRQADLVKFADAVPTPDRKMQDVQAARSYIRLTRPIQSDNPATRSNPERQP